MIRDIFAIGETNLARPQTAANTLIKITTIGALLTLARTDVQLPKGLREASPHGPETSSGPDPILTAAVSVTIGTATRSMAKVVPKPTEGTSGAALLALAVAGILAT